MPHPPRVLSRALALVLTAGALALAPSAAHAVDPIVGPQTSGDTQFPNVGNGGYDVSDYDITMNFTPATIPGITTDQSIVATTVITASTTGAPLSQFSLDFEGLTVDSVKVNNVAATFSRVTNAAQTKYKLVVTPATPVDGVFTTTVAYHGTPSAHTDADGSKEGWNATSDGATFVNQPVGAMTGFPNNNTPSDKATYTFSINIPSTISGGASAAVANGVLVSNATASGRTTWIWDVAKPMASELSLISIGRYNMSTSTITLANGLGTVKEWSFVDPTTTASASFATTRGKIKPILDFLSARYSTYPANATGIVVDNVTGLGINYALETQDRPFFPGSVADATLTHELMHQWFGDNVSPRDWNHLWLNEGPATYSEAQYVNENTTESTFYTQYTNTASDSATWTVPAANESDNDSTDLFDAHVYDRGAMALEALRTAVGPTMFLAIMKEWQVRYGQTSRNTAEFIALAEELSGKELSPFFQDWIYDADKPAWPGKFNLSLTTTPASGTVGAGGAASWKLTAANTGKVALAGAVVTLDVSAVLDDATIGTLPSGVTQNGNVLTWTIPSTATAASSTATIPFTVKGDVTQGTMTAVASIPNTTLGGTCTTCTAELAAGLEALSPSADPTIGGTTKVGQTLSALTDGWAAGTGFAYQWKRDGSPIDNATGATYDLVAADLGAAITVTVTGSKAGFNSVTRTSAPTAAVAAGDQVLTPTPTITGTPAVGETLTGHVGTWDADVTFGYQWSANEAPITGATDATYEPVVGDIGKTLTFSVTGSKAGYTSQTRTSTATDPVAEGTQSATPVPTISGSPKVGGTLTAVPGDWDADVTKSYQWAVNGLDVTGATDPTYTPVVADLNKTVTVAVTGTKPGYKTVTRTSLPTSAVAEGTQGATPTPTISGTAKVGATLTAVPGDWDAGVTKSYQWTVDNVEVDGATGTTYDPVTADIGKVVRVKVTGTKPGYQTVAKTSDPTAAVAPADQGSTPTPTISGIARVGEELTANAGSWDLGVTLTYQWKRNGVAIPGATSGSYRAVAADQGKKLSVSVTGTRTGYTTVTRTSDETSDVMFGVIANAPRPAISGKVKVGRNLTAQPGTWPNGVTLRYQWYVGSTPVTGATVRTIKVTKALKGLRLRVRVTGTKPGYLPVTMTSKRTKKVVGGRVL